MRRHEATHPEITRSTRRMVLGQPSPWTERRDYTSLRQQAEDASPENVD